MNKSLLKSGSALVYGLIIISAVVIILVSLLQFVTSQLKNSFWQEAKGNSFQIAEAGIYYYKWYLAHELDGRTPQQVKEFWESTPSPLGIGTPYEAEYKDPSGGALGKYKIEVTPPESFSTIVIVKSTGWTYKYPNIKKTVKVRFRRPSWSEYAVLADDVMRFGAGTNVYGKIHSNNGVRFDGVAYNKVTSSVEEYLDPDTGTEQPGVWTSQPDEEAVFLAGKEFPVPKKDFNSVTASLSLMKEEADDNGNGIYLGPDTYPVEECHLVCMHWWWWWCTDWDEVCEDVPYPVLGYHIILGPDNFQVKKVTDYDTWRYNIESETSAQTYSYPDSGLIFSELPLWVEGTISGERLAIVSANLTGTGADTDIYIEHDINYTNTDGTDIIGLVAQNNISIGYYAEDVLDIDAAILAQKGRVGQNHYGSSYHKSTITVYGSIATFRRYGFAYTDGSGYTNRNIYYDNNLLYWPPPFFPTGTQYSLDLWEELRPE